MEARCQPHAQVWLDHMHTQVNPTTSESIGVDYPQLHKQSWYFLDFTYSSEFFKLMFMGSDKSIIRIVEKEKLWIFREE